MITASRLGVAAAGLALITVSLAPSAQQSSSEPTELAPLAPASFPWQVGHAPYEAITHFARGIAAARGGDLETARTARAELARLKSVIDNIRASTWQTTSRRMSCRAVARDRRYFAKVGLAPTFTITHCERWPLLVAAMSLRMAASAGIAASRPKYQFR